MGLAEKMRCKICGFVTVRCGISQHVMKKHRQQFLVQNLSDITESLGFESKEERLARQLRHK